MGLFEVKRINLGNGDWVDVKRMSVVGLRELRQSVANVDPGPGESLEEAQGFEVNQMALERAIVAWSDDTPVSPQAIANLPYDVALAIAAELGVGAKEAPLDSGQDSGVI